MSSVLLAELRPSGRSGLCLSGMQEEGVSKDLPAVLSEAELHQESSFGSPLRMRQREQVVADLGVRNDCMLGVGKEHSRMIGDVATTCNDELCAVPGLEAASPTSRESPIHLTLGISRSGAHDDTRRCRLHAELGSAPRMKQDPNLRIGIVREWPKQVDRRTPTAAHENHQGRVPHYWI